MGIENVAVKSDFAFIYKEDVGQGLTEHEYDYVFFGNFNDAPNINTDEVCNWKYVAMNDLKNDLESNPNNYTIWFRLVFNKVQEHITAN